MKEVTITFHTNSVKPVTLICEVAGSIFEKTKGLMDRACFFLFCFQGFKFFG